MEMNQDTINFIKEREEKLGAPLLFRTYSTWYGRIGKEEREYGVFLYTDGKTMVYEDFERNPQIASAEKSMKLMTDKTQEAATFGKLFRRLVTKVTLNDGSVIFFELMDHKDFVRKINEYRRTE